MLKYFINYLAMKYVFVLFLFEGINIAALALVALMVEGHDMTG